MGRRRNYRDVLDQTEQKVFDRSGPPAGEPPSAADDEIRLLRVLVNRLIDRKGADTDEEVVGRMVARVDRLLRTRHAMLASAGGPTDANRLIEIAHRAKVTLETEASGATGRVLAQEETQ